MAIGRVPGETGIQPTIVDAKGDIIAATAADSVTRLAVGSNNQVLTADSATATGLKWAAPDPLTTKGDLFTFSTTEARLPVGTNGHVLTADSAETTGLKWRGFAGCYLSKSASQSVTAGSYTAITWDVEAYDTNAFHNNSTNTSRITIPSGLDGYYAVYYQLNCGNGDLTHTSGIAKNGTRINSFAGWKSVSSGSGGYSSHLVLNLVAGDYLEAVIYTSNTLQVDSNAQNAQPSVMWAYYLGV